MHRDLPRRSGLPVGRFGVVEGPVRAGRVVDPRRQWRPRRRPRPDSASHRGAAARPQTTGRAALVRHRPRSRRRQGNALRQDSGHELAGALASGPRPRGEGTAGSAGVRPLERALRLRARRRTGVRARANGRGAHSPRRLRSRKRTAARDSRKPPPRQAERRSVGEGRRVGRACRGLRPAGGDRPHPAPMRTGACSTSNSRLPRRFRRCCGKRPFTCGERPEIHRRALPSRAC